MDTIPDEIAKLKSRIKKLEEENYRQSAEISAMQEKEKDLTRREDALDKREDEMFREKDRLRAKARRRERDQLEKATAGTRIAAVKALTAMLPQAKAQAQKGKPALLRLILRSTR